MRSLALIRMFGLACASPEPSSTPAAPPAEPVAPTDAAAARLYDLSCRLEAMDGKEIGLDYFTASPLIMAMFLLPVRRLARS